MSGSHQALVSVVTPVYNGEKHMPECIESVLRQTYEHWEYIIVNNCSTDRTLEIANAYAKKDRRIRVHNSNEFRKIIANWNHALRQISPESKYCKIVHADDWLFPECIEKMVAVAEQHPTVGLVGAYRLKGKRLKGLGFPHSVTVVPGQEVCRGTFRRDYYLFGSPTTTLIRADLIRRQKAFYNEDNLHADLEVCFEVLQHTDFGFVHQVLTATRMHAETHTKTVTKQYETSILAYLAVLKRYGPVCCNDEEYRKSLNHAFGWYYRIMADNLFHWREKEFWDFQKKGLADIGFRFSIANLMYAALLKSIGLALHPRRTAKNINRRVMKHLRRNAISH